MSSLILIEQKGWFNELLYYLISYRSGPWYRHRAGVAAPSLRCLPVLFVGPFKHLLHVTDLVLAHCRHVHVAPAQRWESSISKHSKTETQHRESPWWLAVKTGVGDFKSSKSSSIFCEIVASAPSHHLHNVQLSELYLSKPGGFKESQPVTLRRRISRFIQKFWMRKQSIRFRAGSFCGTLPGPEECSRTPPEKPM